MPNRTLAQIRSDNPPSPLTGDELNYAVQGGDDTAFYEYEKRRLITEELTANRLLTAADAGKAFYTLSSTSANISITVPSGLGDGFNCMWSHTGTGVLSVVGSGVTVVPPQGGSLDYTQNSDGSMVVYGADSLVKLQGSSEPSP